MKEEHPDIEQVWRYVSGAMDTRERAAFARRLQEDSDLRQVVADRERMNARLTSLMRDVSATDEQVRDRILEALEREEQSHESIQPRARSTLVWFPWDSRFAFGSALAAAAAVLVIAGAGFFSLPVQWNKPLVLQNAGYREGSGSNAMFATYREEEFLVVSEELRRSVARRYREETPFWRRIRFPWKKEWQIGTSFQELQEGRVAITFEATGVQDGKRRIEWCEYYHDLGALREDVNGLARRAVQKMLDAGPPEKKPTPPKTGEGP